MPYVYWTGFEHGLDTLTVNGGGIANTIGGGGAPTVQGAVKHSGDYACRCVVTGTAATRYARVNVWSTENDVCGSGWFRYDTFPDADNQIFVIGVALGQVAQIRFQTSTKKLQAYISGGTIGTSTTVLVTGTFYRVAYRYNVSANPSVLNVSLYNSAGTLLESITGSLAQAATTCNYLQWGINPAAIGDGFWDDLACSDTGTEHPLANTQSEGLRPSSDGTHNAGTGVMQNQSGVDIDGSTVFAYSLLNDNPWLTAPSAYIQQAANGGNNYVTVNFADTAQSSILGVMGILQYRAFSTTACNGGCVINDEDALSTTLWGVSGTPADYSEGSAFYKRAKVRTPTGGWDATAVNALSCQAGFSTDANPDPYWLNVALEVLYTPVSGNTYNDAFSLTRVQAVSDSLALTIDASFSLGRVDVQADGVLATMNDSVSLNRVESISVAVNTVYSLVMSLNRILTEAVSGGASFTDTLTLNKYLTLTESSIRALNDSIALNKSLNIVEAVNVVYSVSTSLARILGVQTSTTASLGAALSLAKSLGITVAPTINYQVALALLKSLALVSDATVSGGAQTYEDRFSLSKVLAESVVSTMTLGEIISLSKFLSVSLLSTSILQASITLNETLTITLVGGLLLESLFALSRKEALTDSVTKEVNGSFGLTDIRSIANTSVATLASQLSLSKSLSISDSVQMVLEDDISLGKVLAIQISGGMIYDEALVLAIYKAITLSSELVQFVGQIPAKIVIGDSIIWLVTAIDTLASSEATDDQTTWTITIRDSLVTPGGIIGTDNPQADIDTKDADHV